MRQVGAEFQAGFFSPVAPKRVVSEVALLGDGHEPGAAELREVVLDRRLAQLELVRDLVR